MSDLSEEEETNFAEMDALTCDEVLDMHLFLEEFNGDFKELFS